MVIGKRGIKKKKLAQISNLNMITGERVMSGTRLS
jgi:hypothetical protein